MLTGWPLEHYALAEQYATRNTFEEEDDVLVAMACPQGQVDTLNLGFLALRKDPATPLRGLKEQEHVEHQESFGWLCMCGGDAGRSPARERGDHLGGHLYHCP